VPKKDFYETPAGNVPVLDFIEKECPFEVQAKITSGIDDIEKYGTQLLYIRPGVIKALGNKLFELKVFGEDKCYRVIHAFVSGNIVVFLHGFVKKRQKTDPEDIAESLSRLKKYLKNR
jgi:phage-related protein